MKKIIDLAALFIFGILAMATAPDEKTGGCIYLKTPPIIWEKEGVIRVY